MHNSQTPPVGSGNANEEITIKLPRRLRYKSNPDVLQSVPSAHLHAHTPGGISSAENTPAPSVGKQSSAPGTPTPRAYSYLTDDTEESNEERHGYGVSPHLGAVRRNTDSQKLNKRDHIEIIKVQSQLKKWLADKNELILPEFIELMQKIAPHISSQQATQMFNRVDQFDDGQIQTKVLLHDEFLPRMILEVFREDEDDVDTTDVDDVYDDDDMYHAAPWSDMDKKQLYEENVRLKTWIREQGQPAVDKAQHLEGILEIYENERGNAQLEAQQRLTIQQQLNHLKGELDGHVSDAEAFAEDNRKLRMAMMESQTRWQALQDQLKRKDKELKQYKKLANELQTINEKYVKKNEQLTESKQKLEVEAQELRQQLLQYENEVVQIYYDQQEEMENIQHEMEELKTDLDENTISAANAAAAANNDIASIGERFNRTIKINRSALNDSTMESVIEHHDDEHQRQQHQPSSSYVPLLEQQLSNQSDRSTLYTPASGNYALRRALSGHGKVGSSKNKLLRFQQTSDSGKHSRSLTLSGQLARSSHSFTTDDIDSAKQANMNETAHIQRERKSDRASDDENENEAVFLQPYEASDAPSVSDRDRDSRRRRHRHNQSRSMDFHNPALLGNTSNVFEDAVNAEVRNEMKTKIRHELIEDFQLKLEQRDIENRWKMNKQMEKVEREKQEMMDKYEQLIAKYERDLHASDIAVEPSTSREEHDDYKINIGYTVDRGREHDLQIADRASIDASSFARRKAERKKNRRYRESQWHGDDFWSKIEKLYHSTSVMWSFPLYKI